MKMILILAALLLSGCATLTPPVKKDIVKSAVINKDYDKTWSSLIRAFADKNVTFKNMDKASGLITSDLKTFDPFDNNGLIDCGKLSGHSIVQQFGAATYNVYVEKETASTTRVTVNIKPVMTSKSGGQFTSLDCYSTGLFEKDILDLIK
jgi:hypothetical protein